MHQQLHQWIVDWINTTVYLPDGLLEKKWTWQGYDEGIRFAFFRVLEELRWMESVVLQQQAQQGFVYNAVHTMLTPFHQRYWGFRTLFAGVEEKLIDQSPGEKEMTLRDILYHVLETEWAFYGLFRYTFNVAGTSAEYPLGEMPRDFLNQHFEQDGHFHESIFNGDVSTMLGFYDHLHLRVMEGLSEIPESGLAEMIGFWEPQPMPARFRLIRFEAHLLEHSVHAEKVLTQFSVKQSEIKRLLCSAAFAFAGLEARLMFYPLENTDLLQKRFDQLQKYTDVIKSAWEQ